MSLSLCFFINGCAGLKSLKEKDREGLPYYLPKGLIHVKVKRETGNTKRLAIEYAKVEIIPDGDYGYTLQYQSSSMSDDKVLVETTSTGLLKEITFTADERSDEFIVKFAEVGKEIFKALTFTPHGIVQEGVIYETVYDCLFDPFNPEELERVNKAVKDINSNFEIKFPASNEKAAMYSDCNANNVCFRTESLYPLIFEENNKEIQRVYIQLPDRTRIGNIAVTRAAFVNKVTKLTFNSGVLTKLDITKPSETIAAIQIPIDIVKSIVSIPGEIFKLRLDYSTASKQVLDAQKNELQAKQDLIDKQRELLERKQRNGPANMQGE